MDCEMCKANLKRDCNTNCPIIRVSSDNYIVMSIIYTYGGIMFKEGGLSAAGIKMALDAEGIPENERALYVRLIQAYFIELNKGLAARAEREAKIKAKQQKYKKK